MAVERSGIPGETRCHSVTKEQRRALLGLLKDFPVEVEGFRPLAEAIVTSGGVSLREISPKTMESKLVGGLVRGRGAAGRRRLHRRLQFADSLCHR